MTTVVQEECGVERYTRVAVALHWLLAALLIGQLVLGWWMLDVPKSPPGLRAGWFNLHKSIGLTLFALVAVRLAWRATNAPPDDFLLEPWQRTASRAVHGLLYLCMLALPLTGYLGSTFTRYPVRYFGWALPGWNRDWPLAKHWMSTLHEFFVWFFVALALAHIAAALWHAWKRDGVNARMTFGGARA